MRILVIPDVHLKPFMFIRAKELLKKGIAEQSVCLMDIPDDWQKQYQLEEYVKTYEEAIAFAKEFPNSLWCYGNHDLCYLWNERESGYSPIAPKTVCVQMARLQETLTKDNPIRYVQKVDNVLFCHGGISWYFVDKYVSADKYDDISYVVDTINSLDHYDMWCDDSPIWYRPQYYKGKMYQSETVLQVVGHTPVEQIQREGNVISCDVFSTYQDSKPIGTEEFLVIDTKTWEYETVK